MKERRSQPSIPTHEGAGAAGRQRAEEADETALSGNAAALERMRGSDEPEGPPSVLDAFGGQGGAAPAGPPPAGGGGGADGDAAGGSLPFRAEMEAAFGEDFSSVGVRLGDAGPARVGASATAQGETVSFGSPSPDRETVAHELTHVVQQRRAGTTAVQRKSVSDPADSAEVEADTVAARVAAGGPAGAIAASPSAQVHRDATGAKPAPPPPHAEKVKGAWYIVFADEVYAAQQAAGLSIPATAVSETTYRGLVAQAAQELFDMLTAINLRDMREVLFRGKEKVKLLVDAAEPAVRAAAFRMLGEKGAAYDVELAKRLAEQLDPIQQLATILTNSAAYSDAKLEQIRAWSTAYGPAQGQRALADGAVQVSLNLALGSEKSVTARMLLAGGGVADTSPRGQLYAAMQSKDSAAFQGAWASFKVADPRGAYQLLQDATFLEDVRSWVKDAYPTVLQDLTTFSPAAPPAATAPTGAAALNSEGRRKMLEALVQPAAKEIRGRIEATGALQEGFIRGRFPHSDEADKAFPVATAVVYRYRREAVAKEAIDVSTPDGRLAAVQVEKDAIAVLRARSELNGLEKVGTRAGRAPFLRAIDANDYEVGKDVMQQSGLTELSPQEDAAIRALAEYVAGELAKLDPENDRSADTAEAILETWDKESGRRLQPAAGGTMEEWAASERKRRAHERLDVAFLTKAGRPLRGFLADIERGQGWGFAYGTGPDLRGLFDSQRREKDIEDDPDAYSEALTPLDRKRLAGPFATFADILGPIVEKAGQTVGFNEGAPAGMDLVNAGQWARKLRPKREFVSATLADLEGRIRKQTAPRRTEGPFVAAWERKVRNAMREFESDLEAKHGSLRKALDDGGGDAKYQREALSLLGDRDDAAFGLEQQVLGGIQGDASGAHTFLQQFSTSVRALAERLYGKLKGAIGVQDVKAWGGTIRTSIDVADEEVDNSDVLDLAAEFSGLADDYVKKVPGGKRADATRFLTQAFAPLGGAIAPLVYGGLGGEDEASTALTRLGLTYHGLGGTIEADEEALWKQGGNITVQATREEDFETFATRLEHRASKLSRMLAALSGDWGSGRRKKAFDALDTEAWSIGRLADLTKGGRAMLPRLWVERLGITIGADLGMHLIQDERQTVCGRLGVPLAALDNGPEPPRYNDYEALTEISRRNMTDPAGFLRKHQVKPDEVDPGFTEFEARRRVFELHDLATKLPGSHGKLMELLAGGRHGNARPAETKIVLAMFHETFGYDVRYRLREGMPDDPEKVSEYEALIETGGKGTGGRALIAYARAGKDKKEVLRQALRLSSAEKQAVLADPTMLGELRAVLGEGDYERLYKTLTGHVTLYDVVRSDKDVGAHIEEYFEGRRQTLAQDPELQAQAGGDKQRLAALVEARVRQEGRAAYADPAMRKLLDEKFGASKDFEIRARILGGGKMSNTDLATKAVITSDDTDEAGLRAAFEGMTPDERKRVRSDPFFQRRIASDLEDGGSDTKDARRVFSELYSDPGANGLAKLQEARQEVGGYIRRDDLYDAEKAMDIVLGMSPAEIEALRRNPDDLHRVRGSLDEGRRKRLDAYLSALSETSKKGTPDTQRGDFLVEQYVARFLEHRSSKKKVLQVAQECFGEMGWLPDPQDKKKRTRTFDKPQRERVWARIEDSLDVGGDVETAVKDSLLYGKDPTEERLELAFSGEDNQKEILASIDAASISQVIEWSNVITAGPTPEYGSLKEKFGTYKAAREQYAAALEADQKGSKPDLAKAEDVFRAARNRYWDHRLDFSVEALEKFSSGWGEIKVLMWGATAADTPSKKRLLEMKQHVRGRILGLTAEDVAGRVGLRDPGPEPQPTNDPAKDLEAKKKYEAEKAEYEAQKDELVGEDRLTRSEFQQRADVYTHERGSGSGSGAESEGKRVDVAYQLYRTELGYDLADSQLGPDEIAKVKAAGGDFDRKVKEYKEAKARLSSILKLIAKALIIAVATALTGGAGGILATMLVAGVGAMADNVIDSIVLGNDFDWEEDGVKHLLKEVGTAAFTFGVGKAFKAIGAVSGMASKFQKVAAFEQRLAEGATQSFKGMAINYAYQSGKSVVMAPLSAVSDSAIDLIDPSEWKYGWEDYGDFAGETFQTHFDAMGDNIKAELIQNLAAGLVGLGRGKLSRNANTVPGLDAPDSGSPPTKRRQSMLKAVVKHLGTTAVPDALADLTESGLALLITKIKDEGVDGLSLSDEEIEDFLLGLGARALKRAGTAAGTARRANAIDDHIAKTGAETKLDPTELAHYRAHLEGADMGILGGLNADPDKFKAVFTKQKLEVEKRAAGKERGEAYKAWALGSPGHLETRMLTDYDQFAERYEAGQAKAQKAMGSARWAELSPAERRLYERAIQDTDTVLGLGTKPMPGSRGSLLDIEAEGGVEQFKKAALNTKVRDVQALVEPVAEKWDGAKKKAFEKQLRDLGTDWLAVLDDPDPAKASAKARRIAADFEKEYDKQLEKQAVSMATRPVVPPAPVAPPPTTVAASTVDLDAARAQQAKDEADARALEGVVQAPDGAEDQWRTRDAELLELSRKAQNLADRKQIDAAGSILEELHTRLASDEMADTPIGRAVRGVQDEDERRLVSAEFATYMAVMTSNPKDLREDQLDAVVRTHARLYGQLDQGTKMRKYLTPDESGNVVGEKYGPKASVGGSIGVAENTEGMSSHDVIAALGLDYKNDAGKTPFLQPGGKPLDEVFYLEWGIDPNQRDRSQVPMSERLVKHAQEMAARGDPLAAALIDGQPGPGTGVTALEPTPANAPYKGTGGTSSGPYLQGTPTARPNQELMLAQRVPLRAGTSLYSLDASGERVLVARLEPDAADPEGTRWVMAPDLARQDPALAARVQAWLDQAAARRSAPRGTP